jgi:anti-anti-sigma regulatory factor
VLARAREQARQSGGDLLLAAPRRQVRRILALTGLAGVFSVHTSLAGAAQTAGRSGPDRGRTCIGTGSRVKAVRAIR